MHLLETRNVNQAYAVALRYLEAGEHSYLEESRNGDVHVFDAPVVTCYSSPQERVLFDTDRDANPFFHLMESIWMLAGERDARWLDTYVKTFSKSFAEDDGMAWGAYGHRWRRHFMDQGLDQIVRAGELFRKDPLTRRVVIQMWDADADFGNTSKKDLPCNTSIMLANRLGRLDITVTCRSNDIVWGAYGANAVHMSMVHEVLAGLCELEVGRYYQMSNNLHMYNFNAKPTPEPTTDPYSRGVVTFRPLLPPGSSARAWEEFIIDCERFVSGNDTMAEFDPEGWFRQVAFPMSIAHQFYRNGDFKAALAACTDIQASDWQRACVEWVMRRLQKRLPAADVRQA